MSLVCQSHRPFGRLLLAGAEMLVSRLLDSAKHLQRALGRWVRSSTDKGRAAGTSSAAQPASEARDGQIASRADAAPVRSPFADLPTSEPSPGRRPAPAPAAASEDSEQPAASGKDHMRPGLSAGSQEGQIAPASPQATEPGAGRPSQSVGQEHHSSASFHPKSSMSSTQSTGGLAVHQPWTQPCCTAAGSSYTLLPWSQHKPTRHLRPSFGSASRLVWAAQSGY